MNVVKNESNYGNNKNLITWQNWIHIYTHYDITCRNIENSWNQHFLNFFLLFSLSPFSIFIYLVWSCNANHINLINSNLVWKKKLILINQLRCQNKARVNFFGSINACGVMVIVAGIGHGNKFKSWTNCISHSTNTLEKGMNPIILPPAMGK